MDMVQYNTEATQRAEELCRVLPFTFYVLRFTLYALHPATNSMNNGGTRYFLNRTDSETHPTFSGCGHTCGIPIQGVFRSCSAMAQQLWGRPCVRNLLVSGGISVDPAQKLGDEDRALRIWHHVPARSPPAMASMDFGAGPVYLSGPSTDRYDVRLVGFPPLRYRLYHRLALDAANLQP